MNITLKDYLKKFYVLQQIVILNARNEKIFEGTVLEFLNDEKFEDIRTDFELSANAKGIVWVIYR